MANIPYDRVVELVEQLPEEQQHELLMHLLGKAKTQPLTGEERKAVFRSLVVDLGVVAAGYSDRREDWYDEG